MHAAELLANTTHRPIATGLEPYLFTRLPVLDHGHIVVLDYMGNETSIVEAARTSYQAGTKAQKGDQSLIRYLMRHKHTTPFEMCELKLNVKMPIFVARQWIRHRTASVNEVSGRYSILEKEFYLPEPEVLAAQSNVNKQGRTEECVSPERAAEVLTLLKQDALLNYEHYEAMLNEQIVDHGDSREVVAVDEDKVGIARELARMNLTLNFYTTFVWKIDLHNLLHFLGLRADAHAQWEIRQYADIMLHQIVKDWVPYTYRAFMNYHPNMEAHLFSGQEMYLLRMIIAGLTSMSGASPEAIPQVFTGIFEEALGIANKEFGQRKDAVGINKRESDAMLKALTDQLQWHATVDTSRE